MGCESLVYSAVLERPYGRKVIVGSNPTPTAYVPVAQRISARLNLLYLRKNLWKSSDIFELRSKIERERL